jgi:hypothetical protein
MKKIFILLLLLCTFLIFSEEGFFLKNRSGILIKSDITEGIKQNLPLKKGPGIKDVPLQIGFEEFEKDFISKITIETDKKFILEAYDKDDNNSLYKMKNDYVPEEINSSVIKNNILRNINSPEKKLISKYYKIEKSKLFYKINPNLTENDKTEISSKLIPLLVRVIFLEYNKDNEMETGITVNGSASPHMFPRVWDARTRSAIDIHFCWGWKDVGGSKVGLEFSLNLTNFIMPSLEIAVQYNFVIPDYQFIEPYIGGALYGGFMDGFPIGISLIGGTDIYPTYNKDGKTNFFILSEARLGAVLYSKIYFDSGENTEGIWKKMGILAEGAFYIGTGYRWDKK